MQSVANCCDMRGINHFGMWFNRKRINLRVLIVLCHLIINYFPITPCAIVFYSLHNTPGLTLLEYRLNRFFFFCLVYNASHKGNAVKSISKMVTLSSTLSYHYFIIKKKLFCTNVTSVSWLNKPVQNFQMAFTVISKLPFHLFFTISPLLATFQIQIRLSPVKGEI